MSPISTRQADGLDARLLACASFIRPGKTMADIGTDHAYLPIYLVKEKICERAVASDINEGPVNRAKMNVAASGLSSKIQVIRAAGISGAERFSPDDIVIAGMGGELIRDIIGASEYVKNSGVRLILQPMTMPEILRKYLADSGFSVLDERICSSSGKVYQVICAEYDGAVRSFDSLSLYFGTMNLARIKASPTHDDILFLKNTLNSAKRRLSGKLMSKLHDVSADYDTEIIKLCETLLKSNTQET